MSGLKPTYGRVSRQGVIPLSPQLDHVGVLARGVDDVALATGAIQGRGPNSIAPRPVCLPRRGPDDSGARRAVGG